MMNRRAFVTGLGALLAAPLGAEAQPAGKKLAKIGWLAPYPPEPHSPEGQAFWQEMNRVGFVLNDNARLELAVSSADGRLILKPNAAAGVYELQGRASYGRLLDGLAPVVGYVPPG